jgi:hypothetical protein
VTITSSPTTSVVTIDKAKFTQVWAAFKGVEGATSVGVTPMEFRPLLQQFATAFSLLPKDLNSRESAAALTLLDIGQAYQDSAALWQLESVSGAHYGECVWIISKGKANFPRATLLVATYGINASAQDNGDQLVVLNTSLQKIWAWASAKGAELAPELAP